MAVRNLTITVGENSRYRDSEDPTKNSNYQHVNFVYALTEEDKRFADGVQFLSESSVPYVNDDLIPYGEPSKPQKVNDTDEMSALFPHTAMAIFNYNDTSSRVDNPNYGITTLNIVTYAATSIYKREIWYRNGEGGAESLYRPVGINLSAASLYDFNVGNHRYYEYLFYFGFLNKQKQTVQDMSPYKATVRVGWDGWTITELHPDLSDSSVYTAQPCDVWKFKFNVSPGQQSQNMSKTQQDTLTAYPKFSHGPKNAISGSVDCLLGKDMLPYDYVTIDYDYIKGEDGTWSWQLVSDNGHNGGGYKEQLDSRFSNSYLTSNAKIDMLNAWRKVCHSGNPKLMKDPAGQIMLIQITSANTTSQESWNGIPQQISFEWMQIGDAKNVKIIGEGELA